MPLDGEIPKMSSSVTYLFIYLFSLSPAFYNPCLILEWHSLILKQSRSIVFVLSFCTFSIVFEVLGSGNSRGWMMLTSKSSGIALFHFTLHFDVFIGVTTTSIALGIWMAAHITYRDTRRVLFVQCNIYDHPFHSQRHQDFMDHKPFSPEMLWQSLKLLSIWHTASSSRWED